VNYKIKERRKVMSVTTEDLQYLPYNDHNRGRIFTRDCQENIRLFIKDFKATEFGARLVNEQLAYAANLDAILEAAKERFGHDDVNMTEYVQVAKSLWMLGDLKPKPAPAEQAPAPKPLSPSQQTWSEFRQWSESHTSGQCKERARTDKAFGDFYRKNLERENTPVGDAVVAVGTQAIRQDKSIRITDEHRSFADAYRRTSTAEVKKMSSAATNPFGYKYYTKLLDECISAGLL
jgi:hypothetical protein